MASSYRLGPTRRIINRAITALVRLGVGVSSTYLLTTTGRRTGLARTTPVILLHADGHRWLVSPYGEVGWVHNVRARPEVVLRRGRTRLSLRAHPVDPDLAGPILRRYLRQTPVTAPFFDAEPGDPVSAFTAEAARHPVFQLSEGH